MKGRTYHGPHFRNFSRGQLAPEACGKVGISCGVGGGEQSCFFNVGARAGRGRGEKEGERRGEEKRG